MVHEKLAEPELLVRSPHWPAEDDLIKLVAGIAIADPDLSLRDIAAQLDRMHGRPPRGGRKWQPSSVGAAGRSVSLPARSLMRARHEAAGSGRLLSNAFGFAFCFGRCKLFGLLFAHGFFRALGGALYLILGRLAALC